MPERNTWCEIAKEALVHNISEFRATVGPKCRLAPVVKANAYGHGLEIAARVFAEAGADALCVHDLWEARRIRDAGVHLPVVLVGPLFPEQAREALSLSPIEPTVYDRETVDALERCAKETQTQVGVFIKFEAGTNRQGIRREELFSLARHICECKHVTLLGISMHFADIEDTTDHTFARGQLQKFLGVAAELKAAGINFPYRSAANSAATILWQEAHLEMVRVGISAYGMWPSNETLVAAALSKREKICLKPALTWKTRVAQVKEVPAGDFIGYGRTYRTTHNTTIAVLPVGYYDGYDRGLSNLAYVLIRGRRAPVRGRVCMNNIMVDVTDIPDVRRGEEVVLLGASGDEVITAEKFAQWANTINYEVTTRIAETVPRILV